MPRQGALHLLRRRETAGPEVLGWSMAASACGKCSEWAKALSLLEEWVGWVCWFFGLRGLVEVWIGLFLFNIFVLGLV